MSQQLQRDEALKRAVAFYELDHDLSKSERLDLSQFYSKVWKANIAFLYLGFIPGLALPFIIKYRRTGSTKGVNFMWASFSGFAGMMITPQLLSPIYTNSKFSEFKQQKGETSKPVQIVESLPLFLAFKWAEYYKQSAEDESRILKDPRLIINEKKERTPGFIASGDPFGIKRGTTYGGVKQDEKEEDQFRNSWEDVRKGSVPSGQKPVSVSPADPDSGDIFDDDLTSSDTSSSETFNSPGSSSSWEKIRRGSISGNGNIIGKPSYANPRDSNDDLKTEQEKFEELIERERNASD